MAIVGQSGVGKSSLVRAGLLPQPARRCAARQRRPGVSSVMRPGSAADGLARVRDRRAAAGAVHAGHGRPARLGRADPGPGGDPGAGRRAATASKLLVVVDQFEEIFTQCTDPAERSAFVRNVLYAATVPRGRTVVVVAMRADFYPQLAQFPEFAQLVQSHQMLVAGWASDELREVIQEPAYAVGPARSSRAWPRRFSATSSGNRATCRCSSSPCSRRGRTGAAPDAHAGGLPGDRRRAARARRARGGRLRGAVGQGRAHARSLFLRLIQPGEGTEDTRRRVAALRDHDRRRRAPSRRSIQQFVEARLLTTSVDDATGRTADRDLARGRDHRLGAVRRGGSTRTVPACSSTGASRWRPRSGNASTGARTPCTEVPSWPRRWPGGSARRGG